MPASGSDGGRPQASSGSDGPQSGRGELEAHEPVHRAPVGLILAAGFGAVLVAALVALPREHAPLGAVARYAMLVALPRWKITEPVNEVVYGTRGFDTFGETFLLLAAVIGVAALTRRRTAGRGRVEDEAGRRRTEGRVAPPRADDAEEQQAERADDAEHGHWRRLLPDYLPLGTPGPETSEAMTVVVRGAVRLAAPVLLVVGLYVVAWGYSPGGGFPGGAAIVGVVLFAYAAYGYNKVRPVIRPDIVEPIEGAGALAIVAVEALGLILKGSFSASWAPLAQVATPLSGGILQLFSVSEMVEVATGLILVIFGLLAMTHDWSGDDDGGAPPIDGPPAGPGAGDEA